MLRVTRRRRRAFVWKSKQNQCDNKLLNAYNSVRNSPRKVTCQRASKLKKLLALLKSSLPSYFEGVWGQSIKLIMLHFRFKFPQGFVWVCTLLYTLTYSFITPKGCYIFDTFLSNAYAWTQHITDEKLKIDHSLSLFVCNKIITALFFIFLH